MNEMTEEDLSYAMKAELWNIVAHHWLRELLHKERHNAELVKMIEERDVEILKLNKKLDKATKAIDGKPRPSR